MADIIPTRGAALALAEEQSFIESGYEFLDEKRMLMATALLQELKDWQEMRDTYARLHDVAAEAMKAAILRHGFESLQLYPVAAVDRPPIATATRGLLGLELVEQPDFGWPAPATTGHPDPSHQAEACRRAFAQLTELAGRLAALQVNIQRLIREYRSTERRARALENVLLPETRAQLAEISEYLDEADQEEAIRTRSAAHRQT